MRIPHYQNYSEQWRSQEFLSHGPFPSSIVSRTGQQWAIENQLGYNLFKSYIHNTNPCLSKRNSSMSTKGKLGRFFNTVSQIYSSTLKQNTVKIPIVDTPE
jgi:hypothetical protein